MVIMKKETSIHLLLFFGLSLVCACQNKQANSMPFEQGKWHRNYQYADDFRARMIEDLLEHHLPIGLTLDSVESLLGPPEGKFVNERKSNKKRLERLYFSHLSDNILSALKILEMELLLLADYQLKSHYDIIGLGELNLFFDKRNTLIAYCIIGRYPEEF